MSRIERAVEKVISNKLTGSDSTWGRSYSCDEEASELEESIRELVREEIRKALSEGLRVSEEY